MLTIAEMNGNSMSSQSIFHLHNETIQDPTIHT